MSVDELAERAVITFCRRAIVGASEQPPTVNSLLQHFGYVRTALSDAFPDSNPKIDYTLDCLASADSLTGRATDAAILEAVTEDRGECMLSEGNFIACRIANVGEVKIEYKTVPERNRRSLLHAVKTGGIFGLAAALGAYYVDTDPIIVGGLLVGGVSAAISYLFVLSKTHRITVTADFNLSAEKLGDEYTELVRGTGVFGTALHSAYKHADGTKILYLPPRSINSK